MYSTTQILGTMRKAGGYGADFLLGTGSATMGKEIGLAIKNRKQANMGLIKSVRTGFKDGFVKSNAELKANGGFFKNIWTNLSKTPERMSAGWKEGTGFFSKLGKSIKPLGRLMPFAMNALWLAQSIPDIVSRTKDEGLWGGIKETGKTLLKMGGISLAAAVGGTFGIAGMLGLPIVAMIAGDLLLGKSYGQKKAEAEAKAKEEAAQRQNQIAGQNLDVKL